MSTELATQPLTPMDLIAQAAGRDVSIERMAQLFDLQMRWEANEAKKAFNSAMLKFKENAPVVLKNKHVAIPHKSGDGKTEYDHATLDHIVDVLVPALAAVGIRHHWETRQEPGLMYVTCILTHELGHSESATMFGPYDVSGNKNPIQTIASAKTYLERHTFLTVTGQAAKGTDDDGRRADPGKTLLAQLTVDLAGESDPDAVTEISRKSYNTAKAAKDNPTVAAVIKIRDARLKELTGE